MTAFSQLQNQFQSYVMQQDEAILDHVIGTNKVPKEIRLGIYKNAYRLRLQEILASSYPILQRFLGEESFDKLCIDYIAVYPSHYRSVRWFGDQLFLFLQAHVKYKKKPYLAELAQWEWTSALAFDAANSSILQLEQMAEVKAELWETIKFKINPSSYRLNVFWNVVPIWQAMSDGKDPAKPKKNAEPVAWVVWRKELVIQFSSMPNDEAFALDALIAGKSFGEICEGLCEFIDEQDVGLRAASLLKGWISNGLIAGIIL